MNKPISPAADGGRCKRFIEDMAVRGFTEKTRRSYIRIVSGFAAFLRRSPDTAAAEGIRRFQVHQSELGMQAPGMNGNVAALRIFFTQTLDRPDLSRKLIRLRYPRKLPSVLSAEEVARLLVATKCLTHRAALSFAYGAGHRVAEVASLKVGDIDSARMLIREFMFVDNRPRLFAREERNMYPTLRDPAGCVSNLCRARHRNPRATGLASRR